MGMKLLTRTSRKLPILILLFVMGYSLVYACAWVGLYFQQHPYRIASEWIFENVPKGSTLMGPHWDDRLPLSVAGKDAPRYFVMEGRDAELPLYERDTRDKLSLVLRRAASADYIVFPTPRMADSIPRVPEEYPYTSAFLKLLWSEQLGFTFEKAIKNRPSFLGLTFNDDLADESFSVYDHPKAVIFKNVDRLSEDQMRERILHVDRYEPLPSMNEMLLMDTGGWRATAKPRNPHMGTAVKAFVFVAALAVAFWILVGARLRFLPDAGLGASLLGGIVLTGGLSAVLAAAGILPFTVSANVTVAGIVVLAGVIRFFTSRRVRSRLFAALAAHGTFALFSILAGFVVVVGTKVMFPEYFWAAGDIERFALSFFARNEVVPPNATWNPIAESGSSYTGHLLAGWLVKVTGATGSFAYELCFVLLGAGVGGLLYSLFVPALKRPVFAVVLVLISLVPAVRAVHVLHNGYSESASTQAPLAPHQERLVTWLAKAVPGAPVAVEACDVSGTSTIALRAGLPRFEADPAEVSRSEAVKAACALQDPEAAFAAMMSHGVELLIVDGGASDVPTSREESTTKFLARPDLFASIYKDDGTLVLATAFSDLFPRAYSKVVMPE